MNVCERLRKTMAGEELDCPIVAPYVGNFGAAISGIPLSKYNTSADAMVKAQTEAQKIHGLELVVAQSDNYHIAQAFGCEIEQPYNETPHLKKTAISSLEELDKLPRPIDPYTDGRMPVYLDAVRRLKEHFGDSVMVRSPGTGPFSLAGHALGTENFLMELAEAEMEEDKEQSEMALALMDYTSDALIIFLTEAIKAGADILVCGDSSASPDLISPAMYEKYVWPFEKKVFSTIKPLCQEHQAYSLLHICGNTTGILDRMAETEADILEIDHKVDIGEAADIVGDRACLMGNLDPTAVLLQGSTELVIQKSKECIEKTRGKSPFILGSGCEVPVKTPVENIKAMISAAGVFSES